MVEKILIFILCFSVLDIIREAYFLLKSVETKQSYRSSKLKVFFLGASISYLLTIIFTGI